MKTTQFEQNTNEARTSDRTFGIALSGGGIRSATISLGILRSLGRAGLIPYVDYISSVSGGSYIASSLCSRYVPSDWRGDVELEVGRNLEGGSGDPFSGADGEHALDHLRQSGRHLLPGGAGDAFKLLAIMLRSWLAVHFVIGITLLSLFLLLKAPQILWTSGMLDEEASWLGQSASPILWPSAWMHGYPVTHWFVASWLLPLAIAPLVVAGSIFWSYFLTRGEPEPGDGRLWRAVKGPGLIGAAVVLVAALSLARWEPHASRGATPAAIFAASCAFMAIVAYGLAQWRDAAATAGQRVAGQASAGVSPASAKVQEDRVRNQLTEWTTWWLRLTAAMTAIGLLDSVAQTIYVRGEEIAYPLSAGAFLAVLVPFARQLLVRFTQGGDAKSDIGRLVGRLGRVIALAAGLVFAAAVGTIWAVLAHRLSWFGGPVGELRASLWFEPMWSYPLTLAVLAAATALIGLSFSFLNLSTYANFYASNLRRAYLGATNVERWSGSAQVKVNKDHADDDVALERYYDPQVLAPLHLINVTINDTASHASNLTQRDRRGKPLVVSPVGYLFPKNSLRADLEGIPFDAASSGIAAAHGAESVQSWTQAEKLPLSTWVGISGAAASTGMGRYGNLGLSLLAGLANLRLGYWWNAGRRIGRFGWKSFGFVQSRLKDELLGRFPGSDGDRWYLTDGGHFENSGAYELIRRRIALILVCDNGADPEYGFGDLVTLTRRVRIDFDAELRFIDDTKVLDTLLGEGTRLREAFGTLEELGVLDAAGSAAGPYAALAQVTYGSASPEGIAPLSSSTVIWTKPRICGQEALDLVAYARTNPPFPQQSTLDQSFSEAQWESYYRLGQLVGDRLFEPRAAGTWAPRELKPL